MPTCQRRTFCSRSTCHRCCRISRPQSELDALAKKHSNFQVHYGGTATHAPALTAAVLDVAPQEWKGSSGFVDEMIVKQYMVGRRPCRRTSPAQPSSELGESMLVMVCGPPGMMKHGLRPPLHLALLTCRSVWGEGREGRAGA